MGKIKEQTIKGGIYSYLGVFIATITTGYLMPNWLSTNEVGITKLLISYSSLLSAFASLGTNTISARLFSQFRDENTKHNGFFGVIGIIALSGFIAIITLFFITLPLLKTFNSNASQFLEQIHLALPLTFFTLLFTVIDTYFTQMYNALRGVIYREFIPRIMVFTSLILFHFSIVNASSFLILFALSWSAPGILMLYKVIIDPNTSFLPNKSFLTAKRKTEIKLAGVYGIIQSYSGIAVLNLDSLMLAHYLGTSSTGIYAITFFAGTIIIIPSRPLQKIATAYYADAWKNNDLKQIENIYKRSSINQFLIGALIFLLVWLNLDQLLNFLPESYNEGKYVVFFIALANWIDMASGANVSIIATSPYYKVLTLFSTFLLVLIIITNMLFIPIYGIVGAALASMLSTFIFNIMRWSFLYYKYKIHPFSYNHIITVGIFSIIVVLFRYISINIHPFIDIPINSILIIILFCTIATLLKVSTELNNIIKKSKTKIFG